jgi:hypothetical protein
VRAIEATAGRPFRVRIAALLAWVRVEGLAAPVEEQEQLLVDLRGVVEAMNAKRQKGRGSK